LGRDQIVGVIGDPHDLSPTQRKPGGAPERIVGVPGGGDAVTGIERGGSRGSGRPGTDRQAPRPVRSRSGQGRAEPGAVGVDVEPVRPRHALPGVTIGHRGQPTCPVVPVVAMPARHHRVINLLAMDVRHRGLGQHRVRLPRHAPHALDLILAPSLKRTHGNDERCHGQHADPTVTLTAPRTCCDHSICPFAPDPPCGGIGWGKAGSGRTRQATNYSELEYLQVRPPRNGASPRHLWSAGGELATVALG
jgi:hypothetical protein